MPVYPYASGEAEPDTEADIDIDMVSAAVVVDVDEDDFCERTWARATEGVTPCVLASTSGPSL